MSWRPDLPRPAHRLDRYAFRAGELRDSDAAGAGFVLVLPAVFWQRSGGHLWWRRWGSPRTTADVWIRTGPSDATHQLDWLLGEEELSDVLDSWDADRVVTGDGRSLLVCWLGPQESEDVAREVFGTDLARERADRG